MQGRCSAPTARPSSSRARGQVRLWDAASGRPLGRPVDGGSRIPISAMAFSPDGKTILTGEDQAARLWDAATGRPSARPWSIRTSEFRGVQPRWPHDPHRVRGRTARLWDAATGQRLGQILAHSDGVMSVAFSPDGKTILTGSQDKTARLWDAATGRPVGPPMPHSGRCTPWRSAPMADRSSPGARTEDGAAVGRRHRPAPRPAPEPFGPGPGSGVQPGWQEDPRGLFRQRVATVGRRHRPADRPALAACGGASARWRSAAMVGSCSRVMSDGCGGGTPRRRCPTTCRG